MRDYFLKNSPVSFVFPIDGDCVNERDGALRGNALMLPVTVKCNKGCEVTVNGIAAVEKEEGCYYATVPLLGYRNAVVAENKTNGEACRINVFRLSEKSVGGFRLSSDDNIRFLKELTEGDYASIFDHPYLAVYKKAHDLYGAKVHLNLFWELDDTARSKFKDLGYFNLTMMTDKYKDEFRANSDWLKLAFHARSEYPPKPYKFADAETITRDCIAVCREIVRFAGAECISNSTTVHFGAINLECTRALRALGFRSLTGYFTFKTNGDSTVSYYAPDELVSHIWTRDFWVDTEEDIIFCRIDSVLNSGTLERVNAEVADAASDPHRGGFVSIMIHEQYFYEDYNNYLPDFEKRVLKPCKYLYEHGYRGTHVSEAVNERNLADFPTFWN